MRYFIAVLLLFCCYSSSLYAHDTELAVITQKANKKLINFNKKQKNSLKEELFSTQIDFLHHNSQNYSVATIHLVKLLQWPAKKLIAITAADASRTNFCYHFIFQHLYPKHSFW
jgi:hypothetical protein